MSHRCCLKLGIHVAVLSILSRSENLDLPNVCISPTMLILEDGNLHKHRLNIGFQDLTVAALLLKLESEPPDGLLKVDQLHLLQFIEAVAHAD